MEQPQQLAPATPSHLAQIAHKLHQQGQDMAPLHKASKEIAAKEIQQVADEAAQKTDTHPRRFVVAYRHDGAVKTTHGLEFANGRIATETGDHPVAGTNHSMVQLRRDLHSMNVAHAIKYID